MARNKEKLAMQMDAFLEGMERVMLDYIKLEQHNYDGEKVPAAQLKKDLGLLMVCVPHNKPPKIVGWVFGALARRLEDKGLIIYHNDESKSYVSLPVKSRR